MLQRAMQFGVLFLLSMLIFAYVRIITTSKHVSSVSKFLKAWSEKQMVVVSTVDQNLLASAKLKFQLYHEQILRNHLDEGMVVNRHIDGYYSGTCDSLLFSTLRYVALRKMGYHRDAEIAWDAIEKSRSGGHWFRHPRCKKSTSRDMIVGLLAALTQQPKNYQRHLRRFLDHIETHNGFFSSGSHSVSYLTPAVGEILRIMARMDGMKYKELPSPIRESFSTNVVNASVTYGGYRSHLLALLVWIELELEEQNQQPLRTRSPISLFSQLHKQRLEYVTHRLVEVDPKNMFFKYLRYKTAGALNLATKQILLKELVDMKLFPDARLPNSCDRDADYLWQRRSRKWQGQIPPCKKSFAGIDYLWMAAVLSSDLSASNTISH